MLKMFKRREAPRGPPAGPPNRPSGATHERHGPCPRLPFAAGCFVLALKWLSHPTTARRGVKTGELGMLVAVVATLFEFEIVEYQWIATAIVPRAWRSASHRPAGPDDRRPPTNRAVHAVGAAAAGLVGTAHYYLTSGD